MPILDTIVVLVSTGTTFYEPALAIFLIKPGSCFQPWAGFSVLGLAFAQGQQI